MRNQGRIPSKASPNADLHQWYLASTDHFSLKKKQLQAKRLLRASHPLHSQRPWLIPARVATLSCVETPRR